MKDRLSFSVFFCIHEYVRSLCEQCSSGIFPSHSLIRDHIRVVKWMVYSLSKGTFNGPHSLGHSLSNLATDHIAPQFWSFWRTEVWRRRWKPSAVQTNRRARLALWLNIERSPVLSALSLWTAVSELPCAPVRRSLHPHPPAGLNLTLFAQPILAGFFIAIVKGWIEIISQLCIEWWCLMGKHGWGLVFDWQPKPKMEYRGHP